MKVFLKIVILVAVLVFALKSCGPFAGTRNPLIGRQAPDFTLEGLQGRETSMVQFRGGRPAIIFFWATWCPHCRRELKNLTRQRDQIERKGIQIILVDVGEGPREVKAYCKANNIPFHVFLDQDTRVSKNYRIVGIPTFFFVNKEGIVAAVEHSLPRGYETILLGLAA